MNFPKRSLYLVTDSSLCMGRPLSYVVEQALLGGVDIVQYREKNFDSKHHLRELKEIQDLCHHYKAIFLINDRLDLANSINADGAHIGQSDLDPESARTILSDTKLLGLSLESMKDLENYKEINKLKFNQKINIGLIDYFGVSPIFPTSTKLDTKGYWGLEGLKILREATDLPLVAIGGIHLGNVTEIVKAGADSLAVVSAICSAYDPMQAARKLKTKILETKL